MVVKEFINSYPTKAPHAVAGDFLRVIKNCDNDKLEADIVLSTLASSEGGKEHKVMFENFYDEALLTAKYYMMYNLDNPFI